MPVSWAVGDRVGGLDWRKLTPPFRALPGDEVVPEHILHGRVCPQGHRRGEYCVFSRESFADSQLVACGTVFVERKFLRGGGIVGHIEDIAVSKKMQGRKLGLYLINTLEEIGRANGCYKIILDCNKENIRECSVCWMR
jgi:ribosomal protein S18 acetylase RimI-like enzyme